MFLMGLLVTILLAAGNVSRLTGQVFLSLIAWQHLIFLAPKLQGNLLMPFRRGVQRPWELCPKVLTRVCDISKSTVKGLAFLL